MIEKKFIQFIESDKKFQESRKIIMKNCEGRAWLIGGTVFRSIASIFHGISKPEIDLDFIVENPVDKIHVPEGYNITKNRFKNIKITGPEFDIDFVPLSNVYSIKSRGLSPTIENYLKGTPLDIQAVAYDLKNKKLIGKRGLIALKSGTIKVNKNNQLVEYAARKKGMSVGNYINKFAKELNFKLLQPFN